VDWFMGLRIILLGGTMTIMTLVMFNFYFDSGMLKATTIALTILTIFQWYNIFNIRSRKNTIFSKDVFNNNYLTGALLLTIGLHMFAIYNPFMQKILQTTALSLTDWVIMIVVGFSIVLVEELRKIIYKIYSDKKLILKK
jgi:Ca2+-transporting ATPase